MSEPDADPSPPHQRRPRYRGSHPRNFDEKYKEHAPALFPKLIEDVRARGQTPAGQHVPIQVDEILRVLAPCAGERGVDATLGWGGHAERVLPLLAAGGALLALDVDPREIAKTEARLRALGHDERALLVRRTNFAAITRALHEVGWSDGVDFVLADLGVSSMQIDDPKRGFAFKLDGPLDMRMNPMRAASAADWLARASASEIEAVLAENSDEPRAALIARALAQQASPPRTTLELARAVRETLPRTVGEVDADKCVRRVFQAVRIHVNDELGALDALLRQLPACLRSGGRAAILTFHSGEDRRVKKSFEAGYERGDYAALSAEVTRASSAERRANPRASSAKLRWARKA